MHAIKNRVVGRAFFAFFLFLFTFLALPMQYASAVTNAQVVGAQRSIAFCTDDKYWLEDSFYDGSEDRIAAVCDEANAAEIVQGCDDPTILSEDKYYKDPFITDLCNFAANKDDETGYGAVGGNNALDASTPEIAVTSPLSSISDMIKQRKTILGCYDNVASVTSIPVASICARSNPEILDLCLNGGINSPQYASSRSICDGLVDDIENVYGADSVPTIATTAVEAQQEEQTASCEEEGGEFSFFLCPVLRGTNEAIEFLDARIRSALEVKPEYYENDSLREAWGRIRNVAYILLIPILLMMVIGTALGFSFVDAYTVKRAMPRLLVAAVFLAISYDFCVLLIEVTTVVGRGVGGLIAQPFGGADQLTFSAIFNPDAIDDTLSIGSGILGGIVLFGVGAVSIGILASYMATAALALLIIFVVLTLRELVILFLIIVAPLAILSWIFPGNDKMWKLWWNTFTKLLMLYPLIMALLVTGRAFAKVVQISDPNGLEAVFATLVKLTFYVGMFFFIPKLFAFAGSAFGNIAGMVNDRGKGLFDRNKKWRADQRKANRERIGADRAFRGGNDKNFRGKLNDKFSRAYARKDAIKEGGLARHLKGGAEGKADREAGIAAMQARAVKQHRDHIFEDKDVAEWIGYDDLTGLSSAVASNDWKTLEGVYRNKYRYVGDDGSINEDGTLDTKAEAALQGGMAEIKKLKESGDMRGAMQKAYEMADHANNTKAKYVREEGGTYAKNRAGEWENVGVSGKYFEEAGGSYAKNANGEWEDVGAGNGTHNLLTGTHTLVQGERAFNGDKAFRDMSLVQVTNAFRKHGHEALTQAMTLKALAGGTFYRDAGDSWDAVLSSVTHNGHIDRNSLADMAIKGRQLLLATGRVEGAASFGATMGALGELEQGKIALKNATVQSQLSRGINTEIEVAGRRITIEAGRDKPPAEDQLRKAVSDKLLNTVYEQKGSVVFTHPDIKTGYIKENVIPLIQKRIQNAYDAAKASGDFRIETHDDGTTEEIITSEAYKAELVGAENLWKTLGSSKPEAFKLFGNQIFSYSPEQKKILTAAEQTAQFKVQTDYREALDKFRMEMQKYQLKRQEYDQILASVQCDATTLPDGSPLGVLLDKDGRPILPPPPVEPVEPTKPSAYVETIRSEIGKYQSDPVYQNMGYQWQSAELQWRQSVHQAQMQLQQMQFQQQLLQQQQQGGPLSGGPGVGGPGISGGMPPDGRPL